MKLYFLRAETREGQAVTRVKRYGPDGIHEMIWFKPVEEVQKHFRRRKVFIVTPRKGDDNGEGAVT